MIRYFFMTTKQKSAFILLCVFAFAAVSGCALIETMQSPPPGPERTPTSLINLDMLPTLPTLPPETVIETPVPQSNILYDSDADIFLHLTPLPLPTEPAKKVVISGTVSDLSAYDFSITDAEGEKITVTCDDYCFYVDKQKKLVGSSNLANGLKVAVFGATDVEKTKTILADAIVIDVVQSSQHQGQPAISGFPHNVTYTEYELSAPPKPAPLSIKIADGTDGEEVLAKREGTMLSGMTRYSYGYYGESYTTSLQYTSENNRDPLHPTRANMTFFSNSYKFFDFWYPHVENPYFNSSGIINFGGDWFLTVRMTVDINPDPTISEIIYCDRTLMSQTNLDKSYQYIRSFGLSIYNYLLFYFFQRDNGYGFALNRTDYNLEFDEILFGMVGDYQDLNPYFADNLIQFFGRRGNTWYLAELETPKDPYY